MKKKITSLLLLCLVGTGAFSASAYGEEEYALNEVEIKITPDGSQNLAYERDSEKLVTGVVKTLDDKSRVIKETPYVNGVVHGIVRHYRGDRVTFEELYENGVLGGLVYY